MSSRQLNATWTPPPEALLTFVNDSQTCTAASRWYAAALSAAQDDTLENDVALGLVCDYLSALIPSNYTDQPRPSELLVWYLDGLNNTLGDRIADFPYDECGSTICQFLEWPGDPDITGVGMMISYYLAAIFTTIYFTVLSGSWLWALWQTGRQRKPMPTGLQRFQDGFSGSVNTFLDAALIFAVSMLVAATTRYASVVRHPTEHYSIYQLMGSVYMSTFSVFPALALQSVGNDLRRHWLRLFLWLGVIAFVIVVEILYSEVYKSRGWSPDSIDFAVREAMEIVWLERCDSVSLRTKLENTVTAGHVVLAINLAWWIYYVVSSLFPERWKSQTVKRSRIAQWWRATYPYLRLFNGLIALSLMWAFLELFVRYRSVVSQNTGRSYEDNTWTFGQVLAMATWAPVLTDLASIYIAGVEKGLSSKLATGLQVVATSEQEQELPEKSPHLGRTYSPISGPTSQIEQRDPRESQSGA